MKRSAPLVGGIVAVLVAVAAVPAAGAAYGALDRDPASIAADAPEGNETADENASVAPGAQLMGVVRVQKAEVEGEVEGRAFGLRVAAAASNRSKAGVVAEQVGDLEARLAELRAEKRALRRAHRNETINDGRFRAEMAALTARTATVERLAARAANASGGLPAAALREKGVDPASIQRLRTNAANLTGPEVAAIARSIAGPSVGRPIGRGPPADAGPPDGIPGADKGPENDTARGPPGDNETRGPPDDAGNRSRGNETESGGAGGNGASGDDADTGGDNAGGSNGGDGAGDNGSDRGAGGDDDGTTGGTGSDGSEGDGKGSGTGGSDGDGAGRSGA